MSGLLMCLEIIWNVIRVLIDSLLLNISEVLIIMIVMVIIFLRYCDKECVVIEILLIWKCIIIV